METNAVKNQKVFVTLDSVLQLQRAFQEAVGREEFEMKKAEEKAADLQYYRRAQEYRRGLQRTIVLLGLPIPVPIGR